MDEPIEVTVQQAARELRALCGKSQQAMANFLGMSIQALRNYESGSVTAPDVRQASIYMMAADACERQDLAHVFRSVLQRAMGTKTASLKDLMADATDRTLFTESVNDFERQMLTRVLATIRGQGPFKRYQRAVFRAAWRPYYMPVSDASIPFLERNTPQDQRAAFEKAIARKRQPRKERASA